MKSIAEKIINLRKRCSWSQSELARKSSLTSAAISMLEKGERSPSLDSLLKICDAFNADITDFIDSKKVVPKHMGFFRFGSLCSDLEELSNSDLKLVEKLIKRLLETK